MGAQNARLMKIASVPEQLESAAAPGSAPLQQLPGSAWFVSNLGGVHEVPVLHF